MSIKLDKLLLLVCLFFFRCVNDPEPEINYSLSFPLEVGNKCVYEVIWTIDDILVDSMYCFSRISAQKLNEEGHTVFEIIDSTNKVTWKDYYEKKENGLYLYETESGGIHVLWKKNGVRKNPSVILVPFKFSNNQEWICDSLKDSTGSVYKWFKRRYIGMKDVVTKAGSFQCFEFETNGYLGETRYHYYADGIGLVQKEIIDRIAIMQKNNETGKYEVVGYRKSFQRFTLVSY